MKSVWHDLRTQFLWSLQGHFEGVRGSFWRAKTPKEEETRNAIKIQKTKSLTKTTQLRDEGGDGGGEGGGRGGGGQGGEQVNWY